jgi:hypothetical protein
VNSLLAGQTYFTRRRKLRQGRKVKVASFLCDLGVLGGLRWRFFVGVGTRQNVAMSFVILRLRFPIRPPFSSIRGRFLAIRHI